VFDTFKINFNFEQRQRYLAELTWDNIMKFPIKIVPQITIRTPAELLEYEEECLNQGYEGVMIRSVDGPYKFGRSTAREGYLLKFKRFEDAEAEIIGFEERMHNGNELTRDLLGRAERSSHQANMVGRNDLGALVVRGINGTYSGVQFNIGTGFDDADRQIIWAQRSRRLGDVVKYKYFPTGSKDKPRFPVFLGFRELGT
jgi:DNA ligase-1